MDRWQCDRHQPNVAELKIEEGSHEIKNRGSLQEVEQLRQ